MSSEQSNLFSFKGLRKRINRGRVQHYLLAIVISLAIIYIKRQFPAYLSTDSPLLLMSIAVFLSAYFGGFGPGILSILLSLSFASYYYFYTQTTGRLLTSIIVSMSAFAVQGIIISYFVNHQYRILAKTKELESKKDDFINVTSHELKTPLTSMKMYIGILKKQLSNEQNKQTEIVQKIEDQSKKFSVLVDQLLDITRLNARKIIFKKQPFDIYKIIQDTIDSEQQLNPHHAFLFNQTANRNVVGDPDRISQVITNLITNAVKYSPHGGEVIISISDSKEQKNFALVSVKDSGIGIDKKHYKGVFERFYRVNNTDEKTYPGLGIGLYLSSEIVKNHGGRIWVHSEKDKGSTFYFTVPFEK